jgi:hypothetical protein
MIARAKVEIKMGPPVPRPRSTKRIRSFVKLTFGFSETGEADLVELSRNGWLPTAILRKNEFVLSHSHLDNETTVSLDRSKSTPADRKKWNFKSIAPLRHLVLLDLTADENSPTKKPGASRAFRILTYLTYLEK